MRTVDVWTCELGESPGRAGFWHDGAPLGGRLGAARIGAGLYVARPGVPTWPYHYHYGGEEWVYVLQGALVLRDAGGRRALAAGDLACFPVGQAGAHTFEGPGRFIVFSCKERGAPAMSVYPDSDKLSVFAGEETGVNNLLFPRAAAVDYWYGEGDGPVAGPSVHRESAAPPRPVVNVSSAPLSVTGAAGVPRSPASAAFGRQLGAEQLEVEVTALEPGECGDRYRFVWGREQCALVLAGTVVVRHPEGEDVLRAGEMTCFVAGPEGARMVANRGAGPARVLTASTLGVPANICYPETGEWRLINDRSSDVTRVRDAGAG